ncbi:putative gypsy type transposase [Tanacetum coccineum]
MFRLNIVNDNIALAFMSTSKLNDSILWHVRLGHVHFKRMQDMSKDGLILAFDMDTEKCKTCKDFRTNSDIQDLPSKISSLSREIIPTPFVTSFVSATPEREDEAHIASATRLNLRTIGPPPRFVISSDSSHHSSANIVEAKVDSFAMPFVPLMTVATTVTSTVDPATTKVYVPQWSVTNGSRLDDGRTCHEMMDEFAPPKFFASICGMEHDQLFTEFNVGAARQMSLSAKAMDEEVKSLKAQLLVKEAEAAEAVHLCAEASKFEVVELSLRDEVKVREQEVADLDAQVHELEASSAGLQEKVTAYEGFIDQLEKFQDEKMKEVNEKFDKLCADFVEMALHLEEKFYPRLLTTISGRRWLLTHGMELAIAKCLNSTEYLSTLGAAIGKAVEKGMQEGLSAGITHGAEGRKLTDVAAYNPSAEADYLSALQRLQSVNFSLIAELTNNLNFLN